MSRSNLPEQTRMKAIRSRWRGSMLAWILKMKAENLSRVTGISTGVSPATERLGWGGMESARNPSSRSWIPKLLTALPK